MARKPRRSGERSWRLSIATYLGLGLGGLVFVAVAGVLWYGLAVAFRNTSELLEDKSRLLLGALTGATQRYLDGARAPAESVAGMIESGELDPSDGRRLVELLQAALAASQPAQALVWVDAGGWYTATFRTPDGLGHETEPWGRVPDIPTVFAEAERRGSSEPYWAAPVYIEEIGTHLNLRRPVWRDGRLAGMVVATVRVPDLARFVAGLETEFGQVAFILHDHDFVLAHRNLTAPLPGLGPGHPLPRLDEIGDEVLAAIWTEGWQDRRLRIGGEGHVVDLDGADYVFLYTTLPGQTDAPWLVGSYFAEDTIGEPVFRMLRAIGGGLAGLVAAVAAALLLGQALRRPITRLATAADAIRNLALEQVPKLPGSRFRELDEADQAFNAMSAALRGFALYVPRALVLALIERGDVAELPSDSREVTVLFSDIVDFTTRTEKLGAQATAAFLNEHFRLSTACIEAEGGTVDKYLGDGMMALWNAVADQPDHRLRAVRAACAIAQSLRRDNRRRAEPVRVRIGIHTGTVVVGNIGTATRMNYTVVGDAVNAAERLETLGKELLPDADVAIVVSATTVGELAAELPLRRLGRHRLRGREAPTEVFAVEV